MSKFKLFWSTLSLPAQAGTIALILLFLVGIFSGGQSCGEKRADRKLEEREAKRESQREALESERDAAIGRATAAEDHAKALESQIGILELTVEANGKRAEVAQEAIENEAKKLDEEIAGIGIDVDSCERVQRLCARLKDLHIYPREKECRCR